MPKPIKLTPALIQKMMAEFGEALTGMKLSDGKVTYTRSLTYSESAEDKISILFEPVAYAKMLMLLHEFNSEVAWHGVVDRVSDREFIISDILVYPQTVTGATVTTDQERYQTWLMELDDEVFNKVRMQGHSHVNMSTTPSSVDEEFYSSILKQLTDEDYYIFMIYNKRLEKTVKVYDLKNNTFYDGNDVTVGIHSDAGDLDKFVADAKKDVVHMTYSTASTVASKADATIKSTKKSSGGKGKSSIKSSPGYYGGYSNYGAYGGPYGNQALGTDYDSEIFGRKADWWNT